MDTPRNLASWVSTDLLPDYYSFWLVAGRGEYDEDDLGPMAEAVAVDPAQVVYGPWWVRVNVRAFRPRITMQRWFAEPDAADTEWRVIGGGILELEQRYLTVSFTTAGLEGAARFYLPEEVVHSRALVKNEGDEELEEFMFQFWDIR